MVHTSFVDTQFNVHLLQTVTAIQMYRHYNEQKHIFFSYISLCMCLNTQSVRYLRRSRLMRCVIRTIHFFIPRTTFILLSMFCKLIWINVIIMCEFFSLIIF